MKQKQFYISKELLIKMRKLIIVLILFSIILGGVFFKTDELYFKNSTDNVLLINNEESIPAFNEKIKDYYVRSFSALKENSITFGNKTYFYKKKNIQKNEKITFFVDKKIYYSFTSGFYAWLYDRSKTKSKIRICFFNAV